MSLPRIQVVMEEISDPEEIAAARAQRERFNRNLAWLDAHFIEVYTQHRGKFICVAGEELFVADTPEKAIALAKAAHPEDNGRLIRYIYPKKMARVYANQWRMEAVRCYGARHQRAGTRHHGFVCGDH